MATSAFDALVPFGWNSHWAAQLAAHPDTVPGRVVRHDGTALALAQPDGTAVVPLTKRLRPGPAVGDWVVCRAGEPVAVLERTSLLRRLDASGEDGQVLAANVELVLLVCGLDRPVKAGRLAREATLAWDAGAVPLVVLTKSALHPAAGDVAEAVRRASPGLEVVVTSAREGLGIDELVEHLRDRTTTMIGESGGGKSTLLNAVVGSDAAVTGLVRAGDSRGRHTTTSRELYLLPFGGVLIDMPGIRSVGLLVDTEAVAQTFADITDLGDNCRFRDCAHDQEPDCAVLRAVEDETLDPKRLDAWRELSAEARDVHDSTTDARGRRPAAPSADETASADSAPSRRGRR